jgi:hypothetical protein
MRLKWVSDLKYPIQLGKRGLLPDVFRPCRQLAGLGQFVGADRFLQQNDHASIAL